ncbi:MAG: rRNA pseudouridine synthase [Clostridia bacterium]|nr:rRNA pseudouridine synthase [Clostridia bacterium]
MDPVRLQKYISDSGLMSRRASEEAILSGDIRVDGQIVSLGCKVDPDVNLITYKGKVVLPRVESYTYVLINKPRGIVTSAKDEKGRTCVTDLLPPEMGRLYPVGRLDMDSEGLLILTNDGAFTQRMTHPKHHVPKTYLVSTKEELTEELISSMNAPMKLDGYLLKPVEIRVTGPRKFEITLHEGRNRQIRRMCDQVGLRVATLTRISFGPLKLGSLKPGYWRVLSPAEIKQFKSEF